MRLRLLGITLALSAGGVQAETAMCAGVSGGLGPVCFALETHCLPYLEDPSSLSPDRVSSVPKAFRRYFEGPLNAHVVGYQETEWPNTLAVFMLGEPACELITYGLDYADILPSYQAWRSGPGSGFVASTEFEPTSKISMDRAYAATFLAAPRADGRVTEITFNWNLNFEGLTRLRISYQPLREHTEQMMLEAME